MQPADGHEVFRFVISCCSVEVLIGLGGLDVLQGFLTLFCAESVLFGAAPFAGDNADAYVALARDVDPDAVAFGKHAEGFGVPTATTAGDESEAAGVFPGAVVAEGDVELAVPGFLAGFGDGALGVFVRVDHPGAAEVLVTAVFKGGEKQGVDGDLGVVVEVVDYAFGAGIQFGGDDDHLMAVVDGDFRQRGSEFGLEGFVQRGVWLLIFVGETEVDVDDVGIGETDHPGGVINGLGDHITRCFLALEFDDDDGAVGIHGQQIDELVVAGSHLPTDQ